MSKPSKRRLIATTLVVLLLCASGAAYSWNVRVRQTSPDVFWDALLANLTTPGVSCQVLDVSGDSRSSQKVDLDLRSKTKARSLTSLKQADLSVTTESLAIKNEEYVRYTAIKMPAHVRSQPTDLKKVLNVWAKQDGHSGSGGESLLSRTALGGCVVPLANLSHQQAGPLLAELKKGKVFVTDLSKARSSQLNGQPIRQYTVKVEPLPYVKFMKQVAAAYGLKELQSLDAQSFAGREAPQLTFAVHANTRKLLRIDYAGDKRSVEFSNYGVVPKITPPSKTIPAAELQQRLESIRR